MWNILCVEDKDIWVKNIQNSLDNLLGSNNFEFEVCQFAFEAPSESESAYDILSNNRVHILIADSYFEEQKKHEVSETEKTYERDILGVGLVRSFLNGTYPVHFIFTTAFTTEKPRVDEAWDELIRENNQSVTNIRKSRSVTEPWDRSDKLPSVFQSAAKELCQRMSPSEKMELLEKAESNSDFSSEDIVVCGEEWSVESFLAGWRESGRDLSRVAKDLVTPDLSLASSRAFAIWGVKAITHDTVDAYFPNDPSLIAEEARRQIEKFSKKTESVPDDEIEPDARKTILENTSNFFLPEKATLSSKARRDREEDFQFKGEIKPNGPEGKIYSKVSSLVNKSNLKKLKTFRINNNTYDESEVELHIPVHKFLKDEISTLLDYISSKKKGAGANSVEVAFRSEKTGRTNEKKGCRAQIYKNYIVFRNKGNKFPKRKITKDPATVLVSLSKSNISTYGKFYIATSSVEEENYELFDCTHHPPQTVYVEEVFPKNTKVPSLLENKDEYVTYYIFAFSCWRPK